MFSGIIQNISAVVSATKEGNVLRVRVKLPLRWKLSLGQSISVDGICSTVTKLGKEYFEVEYMPETLSKTTAARFSKGSRVNLERSLRFGDPIDGHFVQGHVDTGAKVASVIKERKTRKLTIAFPKELMRYVAPRGSVTVNGVSLTASAKTKTGFTVALIPHTLAHTNLGTLSKGDEVNVETDVMARQMLEEKPRVKVPQYATRRVRKTTRS